MQFIKIITSNGETRWINLHQITRVTLAKDQSSDEPVMTLMFADEHPESKLTIHGSDQVNIHAINCLIGRLDACAGLAPFTAMHECACA